MGCCGCRHMRELVGIEAHPVLILHIPLRSDCLMRLNILQQLQLILRQSHHLLAPLHLLPLLLMSDLPLNGLLERRGRVISIGGGFDGSGLHYY